MSSLKSRSFNDNVDKESLGRSPMLSAKQTGKALRKSGKGSVMSKMDMKDTYKLIPARTEDYSLQDFSWHGGAFVETQQMFGATPAVNNFDTPAKTVQAVARAQSEFPRTWSSRPWKTQPVSAHQTLDGVKSSLLTKRQSADSSTYE